jgi:hypothetical protein
LKWIGQHIWSFISRFRDDVYLEDLADPGTDTDKFLVVDTNDKVGYRTGAEVLNDIGGSSGGIAFDGSTANGVLTYKDADEASVEPFLTYNGTTNDLIITSVNSGKPSFSMVNVNGDAESPEILITKQAAGSSSNGDDIGDIKFTAFNSANEITSFAQILAEIESVTDTDEAGKVSFTVATSNGSTSALQQALTATGHGTNNVVDVGLGYGAASTTTIAGNATVTGSLSVGGHAIADIDIGSEFEDEDDHIMSSGAIKEYVSSHYTWNHNSGYSSISNNDTEYKYRGGAGTALSRSTTDPTSLDAANANGCFWIAPADGAITRVDIQGETNGNDTYQLRFYKAGASANASTVTLTHMITTPTITTNTDKTFNAFFTISSGGDFSARDRIWFFLQKQTNNHNQTAYFNLHITGTIG